MIRIAIVEDQQGYREMLINFFRNTPEVDCLAACASGPDALRVLPALQLDVLLMDLVLSETLPGPRTHARPQDVQNRIAREGRAGIDCIRELKPLLPQCQFLVLTQHENPELVFQALCAGASGYALKRSTPTELLQAIAMIHAGERFISPSVARYVFNFFRETTRPDKLTSAEETVLDKLKSGLNTHEISAALGRSEHTVQTHIKRILSKLHAGSREELLMRFGIPPSRRR